MPAGHLRANQARSRTSPGSLFLEPGNAARVCSPLAARREANRSLRHHPAPNGPHHLRQICESLRGNILLLSCLLSRWKGNRSHKPWKKKKKPNQTQAGLRFQRSRGAFGLRASFMWCQQISGDFTEEDKTRSLARRRFFNPLQIFVLLPPLSICKKDLFSCSFFSPLCLRIFDSSLQEILLLDENY